MASFCVSSPARLMMMHASFTLCLLALLDGYNLQTTAAHNTHHRRHQGDEVEAPVICPGDKTVCPNAATCCELSSGDFGCCPMPHAVCCADHIHCCPADTVCDTQAGICQQKSAFTNHSSLAIVKGHHNKNRHQQEHHEHHHRRQQHKHHRQRQQHPDESDEEWDQHQMVEITNNNNIGSAYSTPSRNAELRHRLVAAPTHRFDGLREPLELDGMTRQRGAAVADAYWRRRLPFFQQQLSAVDGRTPMARVTTDVACPDGKSKCPAHTTCCPIDGSDETYGCCPSENAVCCEDRLHCCPEHTRCNVSTGICVEGRNGLSRPWYKKFAATRIVRKPAVDLKPAMIRCHDNDEDENGMVPACISGSKCCKAGSGGLFDRFLHQRQRSAAPMTGAASHFCCALHDGVCCAGGMHCCPRGFRCSRGGHRQCILEGNANDDEESVHASSEETSATIDDDPKIEPLITARPVHTASSTLVKSELPASKETVCADGSRCPAHNTCCPVHNPITDTVDAYKCCALSQAACCGESSCCPQGYQCVAGRRCEKTSLTELIADFFHTSSHHHSHINKNNNRKESSLKNNKKVVKEENSDEDLK